MSPAPVTAVVRRVPRSTLAAVALAPAALALWLLLDRPAGGSPAAALAATTAACAALALAAATDHGAASPALAVSAACAAAAGLLAPAGGDPVALLLVWTAATAWTLLGSRAAALHTVLAVALGALIVADRPQDTGDPWLWWGMFAVTGLVVGLALHRLAATAGRAAARAQARAAEHRVLARLGRRALGATSEHELLADAVHALQEILQVECCAAFAFDGDGVLRLSAGTGWAAGMPSVCASTQPGSEAGFVLASDRPVVIDDLAAEQRFDAAPLLRRQGARSGMSVAFRGSNRAYGVLGAHTVADRRFGQDDAAFLQSVAHVLGSAWERLESERATRHAALHDSLTDLPNRALLHDRLAQALTRCRRSGGRVALLLADLDNFKLVNDSLGHEAGDQLLTALSRRLAEAVRASDTVARLGGDEFVVLLDGVGSDADVDGLTRRVMQAWQAPLPTGQGDVWISASAGVTVCEGGTRDAATLLREGDAAMYRAKAAGRGRLAHFDDGMREEGLRALRLQSDLRAALDRGDLRLAFQPIVSAADGAPAGVEALLRWTSPRDGDVSPAEFVALAEQAGLIDRLGAFALDEACARLAGWRAAFGQPAERLYVSVNVSALQLADPAFVDQVAQALVRHRLPAGALALELTETALLQEGAEARAAIAALHGMGVRLVLDDFGTGYSSLSYLMRVPVSQLKIDRSFVSGPHADGAEPIFAAVSSMAAALGLSVVAEGVETPEQLERVTAHGCDLAQGFYFSRPVAARELPDALGLVAVGA